MILNEKTVEESKLEVAGSSIQMRTSGHGDPLLILHGELGFPGWLDYHQTLSETRKVLAPSHPGYDESENIEWLMQVRDLAGWYLEALDDLGLNCVDLMGFSFGGWIAAEMAVMDPSKFSKLVLVAPTGIKPREGEIYDIFLNLPPEYLLEAVEDPNSCGEFESICPKDPSPEKLELWEIAREQSCKLAWRPYMHSLTLKYLLHRLKNVDTMIIWGNKDKIVPVDSGRIYHESIPGSVLKIMHNIGHRPEIEAPGKFVRVINEFLS